MPPNTDTNDQDLKARLAARLKILPKIVRDAILSADVEAHMREFANHHKLHFDQWSSLENEVMFALLGFEPVENLAANIENHVGVPRETAGALAEDISHIVFEPIREMLEKNLAQQEQAAAPATAPAPTPPPAAVVPVTPPSPPSQEKAIRGPISEAYSAGNASRERRTVQGDPHREPAPGRRGRFERKAQSETITL